MNCIQGTLSIVRQITELLETIEADAYRQPLPLFNGATLGQHFRHIFDFYYCLVRDRSSGLIDYASRERRPAIEADPRTAREAFENLVDLVSVLDEKERIAVRADFSHLTEEQRPQYQSSVGRELMYAYDHAIHHLAIIRIGLQAVFPQYHLGDNLGVAPSTVKFRAGERSNES